MRPRDGAVSWREVDGEIVAVDVVSGSFFTLNGTGRLLWKALAESASPEELTDLLVSTFGISEVEAREDTSAFLDDLGARSLIEIVP
jgi:hypothetical protein